MTQSASATAISATSSSPEEIAEEGIIFNARRITQAVVLIAAAIGYWLFSLAGDWFGFPVQYHHSGSVLYQHNGVLKLIVFWIILAIATAVGTLLTSWRWFLAGLFSACLGGSAWAIRAGTLREVLFSASSSSVFLVLAVEQILLVGSIAGIWLFLCRRQEKTERLGIKSDVAEQAAPGDPIFAISTQTLAMGIIVLLLAATDNLKQVALGVFIAGFCATALAQSLQNKTANLAKWYWAGPLLVGLIGYIGCYLSPRGWDIGQPAGTFGPLAHPLPLCYATFGIAGAILGFWTTQP